MPVCPVCGEEDFHAIDGLFYCSLCQTQSQDIRTFEEGDEFANRQAFHNSLAIAKPRKAAGDESKKQDDLGRPWTTNEAFTVIIREQVKSLIKLGASKDLEDVVFRVWTQYLAKTGQAFRECEIYAPNEIKPPAWIPYRDKRPQTMEKMKIKPVATLKTKYRKNQEKMKMDHFVHNVLENKLTGDEEFNPEDKPCESIASKEIDAVSCLTSQVTSKPSIAKLSGASSIISEFVEYQPKVLKRTGRKKQPSIMCQRYTLSFCMIGLMFTNKHVMVADLIRWIKKGLIPFTKVSNLLPDDFVFQATDYGTFSAYSDVPDHKQIRRDISHLTGYLEFENFPEVDFGLIISKYIVELCLPSDLHGYCKSFLKISKPKFEFGPCLKSVSGPGGFERAVPSYEICAMAYIILGLKIIFGLDGEKECVLSKCGKELEELLNPGRRLFIWDDWVSFTETKFQIFRAESSLPKTYSDARDVQNISNCLKYYSDVRSKRHRHCLSRQRPYRNELKDALQKPLNILRDRLLNRNIKPADDSFNTSLPLFDSQPEINSEETPSDVTKSGDSFRYSSLQYITQSATFLDEYDNAGVSDFTLQSAMSESDEESDHSTSSIKRKHKMICENVKRRKVTKQKKDINRKNVEEILTRVRAYEEYIIYDNLNFDLARAHSSYVWLIDICSQLIYCTKEELSNEVEKLQLVYIQDANPKNKSQKFARSSALKRFTSV